VVGTVLRYLSSQGPGWLPACPQREVHRALFPSSGDRIHGRPPFPVTILEGLHLGRRGVAENARLRENAVLTQLTS
jgi:hypothetical protein